MGRPRKEFVLRNVNEATGIREVDVGLEIAGLLSVVQLKWVMWIRAHGPERFLRCRCPNTLCDMLQRRPHRGLLAGMASNLRARAAELAELIRGSHSPCSKLDREGSSRCWIQGMTFLAGATATPHQESVRVQTPRLPIGLDGKARAYPVHSGLSGAAPCPDRRKALLRAAAAGRRPALHTSSVFNDILHA